MSDLGIHFWTGQSGQKYRYTVYLFGTVRLSDAREEIRRAARSDLISVWNPACNAMR